MCLNVCVCLCVASICTSLLHKYSDLSFSSLNLICIASITYLYVVVYVYIDTYTYNIVRVFKTEYDCQC